MAEAQFQPASAPGAFTGDAYEGYFKGQTMMQRAAQFRTQQQLQQQELQQRATEEQQKVLMRPIEVAKNQADLATGLVQLEGARQTQLNRTALAPLLPVARQEFNNLMLMTDPKAKASAALSFAGKYAQLSNFKETETEFKSYDAIAKQLYSEQTAIAHLQEAERLKDMGPDSPVGKLILDYDKARAAGHNEAATYLLEAIKKQSTPSGTQIEVGPDGGIRFFQGQGGLTTPNTTKSQERQYQQERLIREGGQLLNILRPEDLGIQGNIGETAGGFLGQLNPDMANAQVAENRTRLRTFRESALRAVSDDSRFSNNDRKAIEEMLPSDGWVENLPQAKGKLKAVLTIFAQRATNEASRQGKTSWTALPPEEIVKGAREGKIDKDAAAAILDALHSDWVRKQTGGK